MVRLFSENRRERENLLGSSVKRKHLKSRLRMCGAIPHCSLHVHGIWAPSCYSQDKTYNKLMK